MARLKRTPEMDEQIVKYLKAGCIIDDICSAVGIVRDTYFQWIKRFPDFSDKVARAKAEANLNATQVLRAAMNPHNVKSETVKTFSETRLRKAKSKEGGIVETPYEYKRTEVETRNGSEFDWRAALEYLKRRDPKHWSEQFIIRVAPEDEEILKRYGLSPSEAWQQFMQELAEGNAERDK